MAKVNYNAGAGIILFLLVLAGLAIAADPLYVIGNANITGNITAGTGTVFIDGSNSKIGIGTKTPTQKLDVNGNVNVSGVSAKIYTPEICLAGDCKTTWPTGGGGGIAGGGTANRVAFWNATNSITASDNLAWDNSNARLGIGTSSPSEKLQVVGRTTLSRDGTSECCSSGNYTLAVSENTAGNGNVSTIQFHNSGVNEAYIKLAGSGQRRFLIGDNQATGTGIQMSGPLYVDGTGNSYVMGSVGIGTNAPAVELVVNDASAGAELRVDGNGGTYGAVIGADSNSPWIGSRTNHNLRIITNNLEKMRVTNTGIVYIYDGSATINYATSTGELFVEGDIEADGKIYAYEGANYEVFHDGNCYIRSSTGVTTLSCLSAAEVAVGGGADCNCGTAKLIDSRPMNTYTWGASCGSCNPNNITVICCG